MLCHPQTGITMPAAITADAPAAALAAARVSWVVLPLLFFASMLNYLDRGNISFAALQMNEQLGISLQDFGLGSGLFFLGWCHTKLRAPQPLLGFLASSAQLLLQPFTIHLLSNRE
jgi:sugar phosphate permease